MSWRDDLRPASFRGVEFGVSSASTERGRRVVQHEYPLRDTPYSEDLGRKQKAFTVEAYVLGDDCKAKRDALIDALEQSGPGQLVHPYYGTVQVVAGPYTITQSPTEGRIERFSIPFYEAGERIFPAASADFLSRLGTAGDGVFSSSASWFSSAFSVARMPQKYIDRAISQVQALGTQLGVIRAVAETATGFYRSAHSLVTTAASLVTVPATLASGVIGAVNAIGGLRFDWGSVSNAYTALAGLGGTISDLSAYTPTDSAGRVEAARPLVDFGSPTSGQEAFSPAPSSAPKTSTRYREQANTQAIVALVRTAAVVVMAKSAAEKKYKTYQSAIAERTEISAQIESLMLTTQSDAVYESLQKLSSVFVKSIPARGEDLPDLVTVRNNIARPSLVIAYDLYESLDLESDIVARNHVAHPGFVPSGVDLEVIRG